MNINETIPIPDWREEVRKKVEKAVATALSVKDFKKINEEEVALQAQFHKGELSGDEYRARNRTSEEGEAYFETLPEFTEALRVLNIPETRIKKILSHENSHRSVAEQEGFRSYYSIRLGRDGEDWELMLPGVYAIPMEVGIEKARDALRRTTEAPDDLSEGDKRVLGLD